MSVVHKNETEAQHAACDSWKRTKKTDKWMAVHFYVESGGGIKMERTTCNFPTGSFSECMRLLQEDVRKEVSNLLPDAPLPRVRVLGAGNGDVKVEKLEETPEREVDDR